MLNVCVSATSTDGALSTTAKLRLMLGTTSTANDAYQQQLLIAASRWAEMKLGYPILAQSYTETLPGFGSLNLMLSRTPLRAILGIFNSTSTNSATEYCSTNIRVEDSDAGLLSRDYGFAWTPLVTWGMGPIVETENAKPWMVRYIAGHVGPTGMDSGSPVWTTCGGLPNSTSTSTTVPAVIEQAVLLKAVEWVRAIPSGVSAESLGDLSVTYFGRDNYRSEAEDLLASLHRMG